MNTQPTLSLDLLTHIGTFMNPKEYARKYYECDLTVNERMYLAGSLRDKDLLQFYLQRDGRHNVCTSIALAGNLPYLRWLRREGYPLNEETCEAAAKGGYLEMLKWLRSEGCPWDEWTCGAADLRGNLEMLKWLRSESCPWNEWSCYHAAQGGHLEALKWLRSECYKPL